MMVRFLNLISKHIFIIQGSVGKIEQDCINEPLPRLLPDMASATSENAVKIKRLRYCDVCKRYSYQQYFVDYPVQVYNCQVCGNEVRNLPDGSTQVI